jgi:hypothetical protein
VMYSCYFIVVISLFCSEFVLISQILLVHLLADIRIAAGDFRELKSAHVGYLRSMYSYH